MGWGKSLAVNRKKREKERNFRMESSHREGKEDGGGGDGRKLSVQH